MTNAAISPAHTAGELDTTKWSPPLDASSTVSNPLTKYPMTILFDVTINTPIPDDTNNPVEPTEAFKTTVYDITESLPFLV